MGRKPVTAFNTLFLEQDNLKLKSWELWDCSKLPNGLLFRLAPERPRAPPALVAMFGVERLLRYVGRVGVDYWHSAQHLRICKFFKLSKKFYLQKFENSKKYADTSSTLRNTTKCKQSGNLKQMLLYEIRTIRSCTFFNLSKKSFLFFYDEFCNKNWKFKSSSPI